MTLLPPLPRCLFALGFALCTAVPALCAAQDSAPAGAAGVVAQANLIEIYTRALDANPSYRAAVAAFREAAEAKPQALAKLLPQIGASGNLDEIEQAISGQYFVGVPGVGNGQGINTNRRDQFYSVGYQVGVSQVLFDWGLFKAYDEAELQVAAAGIRMYQALDGLRLETARSYFDVLAAQDGLRFATAEKDAIAQLLEQTKTKYESGLVTEVDVKQAQADFDLANADLIQARNLMEVSLTRLQLLSGGRRYLHVRGLAAQYRPEPPDPDRMQVWVDKANTQNLALQEKRYQTRIAQKELERARAVRLPTLDLNAQRFYSYADGGVSRGIAAGDNHELDERAYLLLKLPIFSGGAVTSAIRAAVAGVDRAQMEEQAARDDATRDTQVAFLNAIAGLSRIEALKQALSSAIAAEDAARTGYDVGTRTYTDVLLAVRSRYQAERDYAQARYDYLLNFLKLKQASGTLNHADMLAVNKWLQ
ncbi:MAG: TolC family outer membrane protein [Nevskia sp.]|nr:TolC family outer membrane protein [Nevskia sp.]